MKATQITLTPAIAKKLLEHNPSNRPLSQPRAKRIAESISRGEWLANGETIIVDVNGALIDGQHRCLAVVIAGIPIQTLFVEGVCPDAFATIDSGHARTDANRFSISGEANTSDLSSALAKLHMYINNLSKRESLTFLQRQNLLNEHPSMRKSVAIVNTSRVLTRSVAAACHYISMCAHGEQFANKWMHDFIEMNFDEPMRLLARSIANARGNQKRMVDTKWLIGITLRAIQASRKGTPIKLLRFGTEESYPVL